MKNIKKYLVKIDTKTNKILNENFDDVLLEMYLSKQFNDIELIIIDENNIIDECINTVVNYYIKKCLKPDEEKGCFACGFYDNSKKTDFSKYVKTFIENAICRAEPSYLSKMLEDEDKLVFDCFSSKDEFYRAFSFVLPKTYVSKEQYNKFVNLGPEYLSGWMVPEEIFKYILPDYFLFLFKNDGFNDKTINNLEDFKIGLK